MDCLSHRIDPRFLRPLTSALSKGPLTDFEICEKFICAVPNRNLSQRSLQTLLTLARDGGLIVHEHGGWRLADTNIDRALNRCLAIWSSDGFSCDILFQNRCRVCLDLGHLSAASEYTPLHILATKLSLTVTEWGRLISGHSDLRQLTGQFSKHAEADSLMVYRSAETAPITDDAGVTPKIPASLLPQLPTTNERFLSSLHALRNAWSNELVGFFDGVNKDDFSGFIVYAKDLLDLLFWGNYVPLRSSIAPEDLSKVSRRMQSFGLRAEDLSIAWRSLPTIYRIISRLSWGVRYLSNNLAHPCPPIPSSDAFLSICNLPANKQSYVSASRSGYSLHTLTRSLRVLHRALLNWRGREKIAVAVQECCAALLRDRIDDKLLRRTLAQRIKLLQLIPPVYLLDAFANDIDAPIVLAPKDDALSSAALISSFPQFLESVQGRSYAELRLALHAELDFQNRFNLHSAIAHQRYEGVWQESIQVLTAKIEDIRRNGIPFSKSHSLSNTSSRSDIVF